MSDFERDVLASPTASYDEGLAFFRGQGMLHDTIRRVAGDLERSGIDYVVIGAIALNQHGYKRFTEDIDILVTKEGLETFREQLVGRGYRPAFEGAKRRFQTADTNVRVEFVTSGEFPGDGKAKPVSFPAPGEYAQDMEGVRTLALAKLLELKLASGLSAPDRLKDLADVQEMIRLKNLGPDFSLEMDESVRAKFAELQRAVESARAREREA